MAKRNTDIYFIFYIIPCFMNEKRVSVKIVVRELGIRLLFSRLSESDDSAVFKNYMDRDNIL